MKLKAAKTRFLRPYKEGKINPGLKIKNSEPYPGVYIIKNTKTDKVVYIGHSKSNVYKTMTRHFQSWIDRQYRATFNRDNHAVRIVICTSAVWVDRLEKALLKTFNPDANKNSLDKKLTTEEIQAGKDYNDLDFIVGDEMPF